MDRKAWLLALIPVVFGIAPAAGQGGAGWWSRVAPSTAQEKAYVADADKLRLELWRAQQELVSLQGQAKPSESAVKAKEAEVTALRTKLCDLNTKNRELRRQMADRARGSAATPGAGLAPGRGVGAGQGGMCSGCGHGRRDAGWGARGGRGAGMGAGRGGMCPWGGPGSGSRQP